MSTFDDFIIEQDILNLKKELTDLKRGKLDIREVETAVHALSHTHEDKADAVHNHQEYSITSHTHPLDPHTHHLPEHKHPPETHDHPLKEHNHPEYSNIPVDLSSLQDQVDRNSVEIKKSKGVKHAKSHLIGSDQIPLATDKTRGLMSPQNVRDIEQIKKKPLTWSGSAKGGSCPPGPWNHAIAEVVSDHYVNTKNEIIEVDCTAGDVTLYFPDEAGGWEWTVTRVDDSDNDVILQPFGSRLINGEATKSIAFQYTSVNVYDKGDSLGIK